MLRKPKAVQPAAYLPRPGDRVEVAPKGWSMAKFKFRYQAYVHAYYPEFDNVTVWRDGWGAFGDRAETVPAKLVRQIEQQFHADPEAPRKFRFSIRWVEAVECVDTHDCRRSVWSRDARWEITVEFKGWTNTYFASDEREVESCIDNLLSAPVCHICGCQLARIGDRAVCQRSLDHKQLSMASKSTPEIKQSPVGGCKHNGAKFNAWIERNAAAMTVCRTAEQYDTGRLDYNRKSVVVLRQNIDARWVASYAKDDYKRIAKWRRERAAYMPVGYYADVAKR